MPRRCLVTGCLLALVAADTQWPGCLEGGVAYTNLLDISDAYTGNRLVQEPNGGYLANAKACQDSCKLAPHCKKFTFKTGSYPPGACFLIDATDDLTHRYAENDAVSGSISCNFTVVIPSMTAPAGSGAAKSAEGAADTASTAADTASTGSASAESTGTAAVVPVATAAVTPDSAAGSTEVAKTAAVGAAPVAAASVTAGSASVAAAATPAPEAAVAIASAATETPTAAVKTAAAALPTVAPVATPIPLPALLPKAKEAAKDDQATLEEGKGKSLIAASPGGLSSNTLWTILGGVAAAAAVGGVIAFVSSSSGKRSKKAKRGLELMPKDEESSIAPSPLYAPPSARPMAVAQPMAQPMAAAPTYQAMYYQQPMMQQVQPVPQVMT